MRITARRLALIALALALLTPLGVPAGAHEILYPWKYDPSFWNHDFKAHQELRARHRQFHDNHPDPLRTVHLRFHHRKLDHPHQQLHYHEVLRKQSGEASWYDLRGEMGACGVPLKGLYAAHPTWKCGSLVSVRRLDNDDYVFVRVKDRFGGANGRVIDLSKEAFARLANPDRGLLDVRIYKLEK